MAERLRESYANLEQKVDDRTRALADAMHGAWVAFAAQGDCGWPRYDVARRRAMHFDKESRVVDNLLARELAVWQGVR